MTNKKLLKLILASMAVGALVGCGGGTSSSSSASSSTAASSSEETVSSVAESSETKTTEEEKTSEVEASSVEEESSEEELPAEYDIRKMWAGNPGEELYTVVDRDAETIISYADVTGEESGGWQYVSRSFAYDAAYRARFSAYKKVSFTGKLDVESGSNVVMVKVEGKGGTFEKRFNFESTVKTYEFSLSFVEDWNQVDSILFFANRSTKESGSGTFTISKFVLSQEEVNPDYDIAPGTPSVPQGYTYYNGETDKLDVMYRWGYNAEGEIATTEKDGAFTFTWGGKKTNSWSYVSAKVKNSDDHAIQDSGFKRIAFELTGTAGKTAILKLEGATTHVQKEVTATFTGEKQTFEVDATSVLANQDEESYLVMIFPDGGVAGEDVAAGEITLSACYFDTTEVYVPAVKNSALYPAFFLDAHNKADSCYTINHNNHVTTVNYKKSAAGWESIEYLLNDVEDWWNKDFNRVVGQLKANVDVSVLLKPYDNGANEHWVTLKANVAQDVDYTFDKANVDLTKGIYIFICAGDNAGALEGQVVFTDLRMVRENTCVGYTENVPLNRAFQAADYTTSISEDDELVANYSFTESGYRTIEMLLTADDIASYNKIVGTITATVDVHVILKPMDNGANEVNLPLKANTAYEVDHSFSVPFDPMWAKLIIMIAVDSSDTLTGSVNFGDLHLEAYDPHKVGTGNNVASWSGAYLDQYCFANDCYSLYKNDDGDIEVSYKKDAANWDNLQAAIELPETWWEAKDYHRFVGTFEANVDVTILIKPFNNGTNEKWVELKADQAQTIDYTFDSATCDLSKNFVLFIAAGDNPGALEGKVVLHDLAIVRDTANIETLDGEGNRTLGLMHMGVYDSCYTVEEDSSSTTIAYNKSEGQQWASLQLFSKARDYSKYNTFAITLTSARDCHITVKMADNGANEKAIELKAGVEATVVHQFANPIDARWEKSILFVATGSDELNGEVTISQFVLSYTEPVTE